MFRIAVGFAGLVMFGVLANVGSAQAAPGDRLRAEMQRLQQCIDQLDGQIRETVRLIANSGSAQATLELNRQLKELEKERSDSQFALYQTRQRLDNLERLERQLQADITAFIQASSKFAADAQTLKDHVESHNRDALAQQQAVHHFNALPNNQRSQAEADRLNRWGAEVNARRDRLASRQSASESRRQELLRWKEALEARVREFESY